MWGCDAVIDCVVPKISKDDSITFKVKHSNHSYFLDCLALKVKTLWSFQMSGTTHTTQCYIPQELNHSHFHCLHRLLISSFSNCPGGLTEGWIDQAACYKQSSHISVLRMFTATLLSLIFSLFCTVYSEFTFLLPLPFQHRQVAMKVTDMWPKECPFSLTSNYWHGMVCETWRINQWNLLHHIQATDFLIILLLPLLTKCLKLGLVGIT